MPFCVQQVNNCLRLAVRGLFVVEIIGERIAVIERVDGVDVEVLCQIHDVPSVTFRMPANTVNED